MIGLSFVYLVAGLVFAGTAWVGWRRGARANALFQALLALSFLGGDRLGDHGNGLLALALVAVAVSGRLRPAAATTTAAPGRQPLLLLACIVPAATLAGTLAARRLPTLVDPGQATLVALTAAVLLAWSVCAWRLRARPLAGIAAARDLLDQIGWPAVMPQFLASLGAVFALAGVGGAVGQVVGGVVPRDGLFAAVLAYCGGMALFTVVMGNAFAAFPVMAAAVGVPMLVHRFGADPAPVAAIGMLAGFCGTLLTPMAANYNLVPVALLALPDRYAVIRAQAPTAVILLACNILLLWLVIR